MAAVRRTASGNWYAVHGVTGKILKGQPQGGFRTRRAAKEWAARNIPQVEHPSDVTTFDR